MPKIIILITRKVYKKFIEVDNENIYLRTGEAEIRAKNNSLSSDLGEALVSDFEKV